MKQSLCCFTFSSRTLRGLFFPSVLVSFLFLLLLFPLSFTYADNPDWIVLDDSVRVTFYGPQYVAGDITASGIRYAPDSDTVALGPYHLAMVRDYYQAATLDLGYRQYWEWLPDWKLRYGSAGSCFPRHTTLHSAGWWGCMVKVCAQAANGEELCKMLRVADTGSARLEVDLPDETWLDWGYPPGAGVFTGTLEVAIE